MTKLHLVTIDGRARFVEVEGGEPRIGFDQVDRWDPTSAVAFDLDRVRVMFPRAIADQRLARKLARDHPAATTNWSAALSFGAGIADPRGLKS